MASLAVSNLLHDKARFAVTVVGVVFAVVLVAVQIGLFIGFATTTSNVIDNSGADLWIVSQNVDHIEVGVPMAESKLSSSGDRRRAGGAENNRAVLSMANPNGACSALSLSVRSARHPWVDRNAEAGPWRRSSARRDDPRPLM